VLLNIDGEREWKPCFMVKDIDLPTGYYFGASAATGDLADNHDIISIKVYDVDIPQEEEGTQGVVCFTVHKTFILFTANHCCFLSPC